MRKALGDMSESPASEAGVYQLATPSWLIGFELQSVWMKSLGYFVAAIQFPSSKLMDGRRVARDASLIDAPCTSADYACRNQ